MPIDLVIDDRDGNKSDSEDFFRSSGNNMEQVRRFQKLKYSDSASVWEVKGLHPGQAPIYAMTQRNKVETDTNLEK